METNDVTITKVVDQAIPHHDTMYEAVEAIKDELDRIARAGVAVRVTASVSRKERKNGDVFYASKVKHTMPGYVGTDRQGRTEGVPSVKDTLDEQTKDALREAFGTKDNPTG